MPATTSEMINGRLVFLLHTQVNLYPRKTPGTLVYTSSGVKLYYNSGSKILYYLSCAGRYNL